MHEFEQILVDWSNYCDGKLVPDDEVNLDFSHLLGGRSQEDIEKIFSYFPQSHQLIKRFKRAQEKSTISNSAFNSDATIELVRAEIKNMSELCHIHKNNDLANVLRLYATEKIRMSQMSEKEFYSLYSSDRLFTNFIETINDYAIFNPMIQKPGFGCIDSAFFTYGGNNFRFAYSVGAPLLVNGHLFEHYLDIWVHGFDYLITKEGVEVVRIKDLK